MQRGKALQSQNKTKLQSNSKLQAEHNAQHLATSQHIDHSLDTSQNIKQSVSSQTKSGSKEHKPKTSRKVGSLLLQRGSLWDDDPEHTTDTSHEVHESYTSCAPHTTYAVHTAQANHTAHTTNVLGTGNIGSLEQLSNAKHAGNSEHSDNAMHAGNVEYSDNSNQTGNGEYSNNANHAGNFVLSGNAVSEGNLNKAIDSGTSLERVSLSSDGTSPSDGVYQSAETRNVDADFVDHGSDVNKTDINSASDITNAAELNKVDKEQGTHAAYNSHASHTGDAAYNSHTSHTGDAIYNSHSSHESSSVSSVAAVLQHHIGEPLFSSSISDNLRLNTNTALKFDDEDLEGQFSPEVIKSLASSRLPIIYVLGLLAQLQPFSFHVFDSAGHYLEKFDQEHIDSWDVLKTDKELRLSLIQGVLEQKVALFTNEYPVVFGGVRLLDNLVLIIGPSLIREVDPNFLKLYASLHQASNVVLRVTAPAKLGAMLLLIHASLTGEKLSLTNFLDSYLFNQDLIKQTSENAAEIYYHEINNLQPHNPVSFEHDIIKSIQYGDLDSLERALNSPYAAMRGILAKDALRSQKNLAIVDITLASRALTDIGFPSEDIFIFSDAVIRNVENCRDVEEAKGLARAFAVQCAQKVKERNLHMPQVNASHIVQQACEYMDRHVYDKFDVHTLASELKVSRGYLSKVFKQELNMTMSDYMRRKKISIAAILLANTNHPIDDIALSLAFCSRSHLGRVFLQEKGCSPAEYRRQSKYPKRMQDKLEQNTHTQARAQDAQHSSAKHNPDKAQS